MARGAESKTNVTNKILEMFEGAFVYGKEIRVPMTENGERVEIKITLTCAKENVGGGNAASVENGAPVSAFPTPNEIAEPTADEKKNIQDLMSKLGL